MSWDFICHTTADVGRHVEHYMDDEDQEEPAWDFDFDMW